MPRAAVRAALGLPGGPACTGAARRALLPEVRAREPVPAVPPSQVPTWLCQHRALLATTNGSEQPPNRFRACLRAAARGKKLSQRPSAAFEARRRSRRGVAGAFCFPAGLERLQSPLVFQDVQEKEIVIPERAEEAKLKAKYPNLGQKPGGSDFLMKRLQKGVFIARPRPILPSPGSALVQRARGTPASQRAAPQRKISHRAPWKSN